MVVFSILFFSIHLLFAQEGSNTYIGKEIENRISAVKVANSGDYILLPSGKKYILTKEEIAIARGEFDYTDLSNVETITDENGTEIINISSAHIAYVFPDGQSTHILKTSVSFTAFIRHIANNFYLDRYRDFFGEYHNYKEIEQPDFSLFRARVQYQTFSDGIEEMQGLSIDVYNFNSQNISLSYSSIPNMVWGNVSGAGSYKPVGESHQIEFNVK
jgi:hypothetical protein